MQARMPIQLLTEHTWEDGKANQDPATRAWNLSVALFYKAGGIPWRARPRTEETCFVGVSLHHLRTTHRHIVYSSVAQAFDGAVEDVLALSKMNWNSASSFAALPISLSFARKVGGVMAEIQRDQSPHPSFAALPISLSFARKVGGVMAEIQRDQSPHPSFRYYM
jgi:hypothetical protein